MQMLPLRYVRLWLTASGLLLMVALYFALAPVQGPMPLNMSDKLVHASAFTALMVWFSGIFAPRHGFRVFLGLLAYGVLIEILQSFTATRHAELLDVAADIAGILVGWGLATLGFRRWCQWLETWLAPQKS